MPTFTVQKVGDTRDWNSEKGGPMRSYRLDLLDQAGQPLPSVEWARKASSPAPEVGQKLEGEVNRGDFGLKFKQATNGFGRGGGRSPEEIARIQRMHDQDMALRAVDLAVRLDLAKPATSAELFSLISSTADWFSKDTKAAKP